MADQSSFEKPRWLRDLIRFLPLKSQFVLTSNVRDLQAYEFPEGRAIPLGLIETLTETFHESGYKHVLSWSPLLGLAARTPMAAANAPSLLDRMGISEGEARKLGQDRLPAFLRGFVESSAEPAALIIDYAARLPIRADSLSPAEHDLFTLALALSHRALARPYGESLSPYFNTVVWIAESEGDLPAWLTIGNPKIRIIPISEPDSRIRALLAAPILRGLSDYASAEPEEAAKIDRAFIDSTEGLLLCDMRAIAQLAATEGVPAANIADAARRYKVGVTEDPWRRIDKLKIKEAGPFVRARVKGQEEAVVHVLDIIKRAITGIGSTRRGNRPRGAVFLAGPTGVGKTELAKTVTSLLFGDESAYIRFDMSEFSAEHSDQRLLGAPPGYVGFDLGGELTNAVRERPFSVILFDEIEKAHPRVMDKFLQILDDGVLTSGRGDRVYFSEALIIFTSNLGIYRLDESGARELNVSPSEPFSEVKRKVALEIKRHFREVLNRPELLNRIGENIIIFDFIREDVALEIFDQMIANALSDLAGQGYFLSLSPKAAETLRGLCLSDLSHGGRGIRNQLEAHLLNPLARAVFDKGLAPEERWGPATEEGWIITEAGSEGLALASASK